MPACPTSWLSRQPGKDQARAALDLVSSRQTAADTMPTAAIERCTARPHRTMRGGTKQAARRASPVLNIPEFAVRAYQGHGGTHFRTAMRPPSVPCRLRRAELTVRLVTTTATRLHVHNIHAVCRSPQSTQAFPQCIMASGHPATGHWCNVT